MINEKFLQELKKAYRDDTAARRQIASASNNILFEAKKNIFAIQRGDFKTAETKLREMEKELARLEKNFGAKRLQSEGSYKAAAEEYLEGKTLYQAVKNQKIEAIKGLELSYDSYLGGLCDMIGELVRYATNQAAAGKFSAVAKTKKLAEDIMGQLIDFDMTGYLRTKYDQARGHLRKLEQMAYEIRLRREK
jgi:predicted translin family RNA/ssDNA-binding protein